ncbi:MAG: hypothetical protein IPG93_03710 [Burkholderiales bacterium]|nr:hypothetical protein [Burkholderiales bacterium]
MPDLGDLLGLLVSGVTRARRMADEESALIAEQYRRNPLLEGLSVPRVRIPEMTVELPLLLQSYEAGRAAVPNDAKKIVTVLLEQAGESLTRLKLDLSKEDQARLRGNLDRLVRAAVSSTSAATGYREAVSRAAQQALLDVLDAGGLRVKFSPAAVRDLLADLQLRALDVAEKTPAEPPRLQASILTAEVKDKADLGNAARIRMTLKEEGLEWTVHEAADGSHVRRLSPE